MTLEQNALRVACPPLHYARLNTWGLGIVPTLKDVRISQALIYKGNLPSYLLILTLIRKFTTTT